MPVIRVANSSQPEVFIVTVGVELRVREKGRPRRPTRCLTRERKTPGKGSGHRLRNIHK
jgi:hypothetical protein